MKKKILLILLCLPMIGFGQNLIANGDFEQYSILPESKGQLMNCIGWNNVNLIPGHFFQNESVKASPDYFHTQANDSSGVGLPNNNLDAFVYPYSGEAIVGFATFGTTTLPGFPGVPFPFMDNYREYISTKLDTILEIGETYHFSFYLTNGQSDYACGASSNRIGVYFSTDSLSQDSAEVINVVPQLEILNEVWDTSWQKYSFSFVANDEYKYCTIGNFYSDSQTSTTIMSTSPSLPWSYYFIDKIELYKSGASSVSHENIQDKKLRKIINLFGQEIPIRSNSTMFYIYDDGTVEKKIIIE